jgi:hypothetical protein
MTKQTKKPGKGSLMYVPSCTFGSHISDPPILSEVLFPDSNGVFERISPAYCFSAHHQFGTQRGVNGGIAEVSSVRRNKEVSWVEFDEIGVSYDLRVLMPIQEDLRNYYKHHSATKVIDRELEGMFDTPRDW